MPPCRAALRTKPCLVEENDHNEKRGLATGGENRHFNAGSQKRRLTAE